MKRFKRNLVERETAKQRAITDELRHQDPFGRPELVLVRATMLERLRGN